MKYYELQQYSLQTIILHLVIEKLISSRINLIFHKFSANQEIDSLNDAFTAQFSTVWCHYNMVDFLQTSPYHQKNRLYILKSLYIFHTSYIIPRHNKTSSCPHGRAHAPKIEVFSSYDLILPIDRACSN